tara:strand:+ start:4992 stop:5162 length:171 start_codon:yes stop_codon:yes gene_type:complete
MTKEILLILEDYLKKSLNNNLKGDAEIAVEDLPRELQLLLMAKVVDELHSLRSSTE